MPSTFTSSRPRRSCGRFDEYAPLLLKAAGMTVFLTVCSMATGHGAGAADLSVPAVRAVAGAVAGAGLCRVLSRHSAACCCCSSCTFGLAALRHSAGAIATAILGFGLNYAAYEAEIYRSAILSVPSGNGRRAGPWA